MTRVPGLLARRFRGMYLVAAACLLLTVLPDLGRPTKADLEPARHGHVRAQAEGIGTDQKES